MADLNSGKAEASTNKATAREIVSFWDAAGPDKWFEKSVEFDAEIKKLFLPVVDLAGNGKLDDWLESPESSLALLLVLDQFPRNIYRNSPRAFDFDHKALACAEAAICHRHDTEFEVPLRRFFYLPFMHSEMLENQIKCIQLCEAAGDTQGVKFAQIHADAIRRFGRFPHRNDVLGRESRPEEIAFLAEGGFSG